ncbi:MAG: HAD hydrolase-like protein [Spirochaetota bacterium]
MDGTILNCNKAGRASLIKATKEVFGTTGRMEKLDFQGKTDPLILQKSLEIIGISGEEIAEKTETLKERYFFYLTENIEEFGIIIFPGIIEILEILSNRKDIFLGLLTGNFKESARIKLEGANLNRFFSFGAFGDDAPIRDLLPEVAKKRVSEKFNKDVDFTSTYIVGDTIYDVRCAKYAGAVSIAVGTGWGETEHLLNEKPDYYFDNLKDINQFINILED